MKTIYISPIFCLAIFLAACGSDTAEEVENNQQTNQETPNQDTCEPETCESIDACGSFSDGCGNTLDCTCAEGFNCFRESCIEDEIPQLIIHLAPEDPSNDSSPEFGFFCSLYDCTIRCRLDDGDFEVCPERTTFEDLEDGPHFVEAIATANELDSHLARWDWTIDTIPPQLVIDDAPEAETHETIATFEFSCPDDDCASFRCAVDTPDSDGNFSDCESPYTAEGLSLGVHQFHVKAFDEARNETVESHTWEVVEFSTERQIRGGDKVVCILETTGELDCFGEDPYQLSNAPEGSLYSAFDLGDGTGCGLTPSQYAECWGVTTDIVDATPTDTKFMEISAGMYLACGVTLSGEIQCWGDDATVPADGPYSTVSTNNRHICGIRASGEIDCTSTDDNDYGETDTPSGDGFVQINSGDRAICALHSSGTVSCWGNDGGWGNDSIISQQPTDIDDFTQISLAGSPACGIRENNRAVCWGPAFRFDSDRSGGDPPSTTEFEALGCGWLYCCGLTTDETIKCWGEFDSDQIPE